MKRRKSLLRLVHLKWRSFITHAAAPVSTIDGHPCAQGTGRKFAIEVVEKKRRGKPPSANRIRADQIAAYVQLLKEATPHAKMDDAIVEDVAKFFRVDPKTVWNALRRERQLEPDELISLGPVPFLD